MHADVSAPARAPFLQTPGSLIDDPQVSDSALRLLQALVKLPPRNGRNSDAVARSLGMGKDKTNAARKSLRVCGHWHARKRQHPDSGTIRDQRLASLTPLRTPEEIAAGWAAAEEAVRLGKDTDASRRLGVRILNSAVWAGNPAAGASGRHTTRRRPLAGGQTEAVHTLLPVLASVPGREERAAAAESTEPVPTAEDTTPAPSAEDTTRPRTREKAQAEPTAEATPLPQLTPLTGPLAVHAARAQRVLLGLRREAPQLPLSTTEAHELAHIAGHHLLRGESAEALRSVLTQGLPPDGVRCPAAFVRHRLVRYLPPEPEPEAPGGPAPTASEPAPTPRSDGPVARLTAGHGWRAAMEAAAPGV